MNKSPYFGALVIMGLALMLGLAPQDTVQDAISQLRMDVADLGLRLDKLEHASGVPQSSDSGSAASPTRTMILAAVSQSDHTTNNSDEIAQLQRQNASMMNAVNQVTEQQAQSAGQDLYAGRSSSGERGWGQASGSTVVSTNVGAANRQVLADQAVKERYITQAYISREKIKKLQEANSVPKQIIHGHDPKVIYTLETKTDLTDQLDKIAIGDTVTWTGIRKSADATSEMWIIDSISKVEK